MKKSVFLFIIILIFSLSACSPTILVRTEVIRNLNDTLKDEYGEIYKIKTTICRPTLCWDIYVDDPGQIEEILTDIATFIKTSDHYTEIKEEYNNYGTYYFERIYVTFHNWKSKLCRYEGYYYEAGSTVYVDDIENKYNIINNFSTWYIYEGHSHIGTYEYEYQT